MSIPLTFHYDFLTSLVLTDPDFPRKIKLMRRAGVKTVWLDNYIYGQWQNSLEDCRRAKALLEAEGFEVQAICVPLGHGSAALNGGDEADPTLPTNWRNRVDHHGNRQGTTTCVDETVIANYREAVSIHKELGFTKLFYDDDLRMGSWGPHLQGCYCDRCLERFYQKYPTYGGMSPADIAAQATEGDELWNAWTDIQCDAILRFLDETTPEGLTPGIMLMHNGDRRHGLDVPRIKKRFPHALFRVGEGHFDNASFESPLCRPAIENCIRKHLSLIGSVEKAFSESTTYPVGALSPENWIEKMRMEIGCGLRNLFLMSGNVFLTDPYWEALIEARTELEALAEGTPLPVLDETPCRDDFVWHL